MAPTTAVLVTDGRDEPAGYALVAVFRLWHTTADRWHRACIPDMWQIAYMGMRLRACMYIDMCDGMFNDVYADMCDGMQNYPR